MTTPTASHTGGLPGALTRLHYCLFDPQWRPISANYPLPDTPQSVPRTVCAAYDVDEHPDMPQSVYARMTWRLKYHAGSAGFYLCKAADGGSVWLGVHFFRTEHGVMACHFQIQRPMPVAFSRFFAHLRRMEGEGLSAEETTAQIVGLMAQEGVADYRALASDAMVGEMALRDGGLGRQQYRQLSLLAVILEHLREIDRCGKVIDSASARSRLIPFRLKLQAAQLEGGKGPISVIADNHKQLTETLLQVTSDMQKASLTETDKVLDAIAYLAQSNHAAEVLQGAGEGREALDPMVQNDLAQIVSDCAVQVTLVLSDIDKRIVALGRICHRMRRALTAMEMTRVMCRIETAELGDGAEGLQDIEAQLRALEHNLSRAIRKMDDAAKQSRSLVEEMSRVVPLRADAQAA